MKNEQLIKVCNAIEALTIVYGPLYYEDYDYLLDKYFHTAYRLVGKKYLQEILDTLVKIQRINCSKKRYSMMSDEDLKILEKEFRKEYADLCEISFKEFKSGNEILKYRELCNAKNVKGTEKLHDFFDNLEFYDGVDIKDTKYEFFVIPQLMADTDKYAKLLEKKCKNLDIDKLRELYDEIAGILPRGFLHGYSFVEINEMIRKELKNATYITEEMPKYKKSMSYSYFECLALLSELEKTELYKLVDSDRVLELSINGKEVYVQILGYYGKDKAVIIYEDVREMEYSVSLMKANIEEVPDVPYRISQIECLYDSEGFVSEEVAKQLEKSNLPTCPAFVRLDYCRKPRLVNAKEINLVGAVLNDLLCMTKMVDKQTITRNLGEDKDVIDNTINQVYVYEDKVLFGEYEDDEIGTIYDRTKVTKLDNKLVGKLKKCCNNHAVMIGVYIYPMNVNQHSWFYLIYDVDDGKIIEMEALEPSENKDIGNIILKSLIKHDINPKDIIFNNEITYNLLNNFQSSFIKVDIDENCILNKIYSDFVYESTYDSDSNSNKYN